MSNVIELESAYQKKLREEYEQDNGAAFCLQPYEWNDMVGITESEPGFEKGDIMFIFDDDRNLGLSMSPEDAEQLGMALIQAAGNSKFEKVLQEQDE